MRGTKFRFPVTSLAGSTPANMVQLLSLHKTESKYYLKVALSFLATIIISPLRWIEKLIYHRRFLRFQLKEPPVFIIGFNRSGTTLLHNLMCQDPAAGYTTTLHTVFPHCVLTQKWWLAPLINLFVPSKRPFDNVSMDMRFPQEEEFALSNLQLHSIYNFFIFPAEFDWFVEHDYDTSDLPEKQLAKWKREYRELVIKSLFNTHGTRYTSKNPQNIPRVKLLTAMFPGAKFIFIYRDPYVVVESLYNFILAIFPGVQLQDVPADFSRENIARFYARSLNYYFSLKQELGDAMFYELSMEDFLEDKIGGLESIYSELNLRNFQDVRPRFIAYLEKNSAASHETSNIHPETIQFVNALAGDIVQKLGYPVRSFPGQ